MADLKEGDRVRRTRDHTAGFPKAGYEFVVSGITSTTAWEKDSSTIHARDALELVPLATGGIILSVGQALNAFSSGVKPADLHASLSEKDKELLKSLVPKGETRTVSDSGGEKGVKAEAWALLPSEALEEIARVYDFGARKYAAHNWRRGYEWSKSFSALCRHIWAFWRGEDLDPESGLSHLGHAGFHVLGLLTWALDRERFGKFDDRYKPEAPADTDG